MRPRRLEMEGFGAFRERTVVDFTDLELVALVGRTGSGKSTIIDAITFALFGSVARYDDRKLVAPVINQLSTRARVQLDFELGDRCYTAVRLVQRRGEAGATTKEARLEVDGAVVAADARGMTTEVERLLGLDADQFNRTVVLPQGRFADFLHANPGDRQETLRGLLGLEIYRTIASAARRLAATARSTADAWRPEVLTASQRLTDERRTELVGRRTAVVAGREAFMARIAELAAAEAEVAALDERIGVLDGQLVLLTGVQEPADLAGLERRRIAAAAAVTEASSAAELARRRRREADAAAAAGPDPVVAAVQRAAHRAATVAEAEHRSAATDLTAAEEQAIAARAAVSTLEARQTELDAVVTAASDVASDARRALDAAGTAAQLDLWITMRVRHDELAREVDTAAAAIGPAADALAAHRHDVELSGAAGYAALLQVGDPCPLCLQTVREVPVHDHGDDGRSRTALAAAEREHARLEAQLTADRRALGDLEADLVAVSPTADLLVARATVDRLQLALDEATTASKRATEEARTHRERPQHVASRRAADAADGTLIAARALEMSLRTRLQRAAQEVAGLPSADEVERSVARATELVADQRDARDTLTAAEDALERAVAAQGAAEVAVADAMTTAQGTRDRLAALGPPTLPSGGPAAAWAALTTWAAAEREQSSADRDAIARRAELVRDHAAALATTARDTALDLLGDANGTREQVRDRLAQAETLADGAIRTFDEERVRIAELAARVDEQDERRAVADQLALHLKADRFEAWLMEAAVVGLVETASARLLELTAGAFSLALQDNTFMVRDHANADELRSARTLSGGETFLASLALALALADATSELAPEGSPALESIFLDEGFGSLDPATLDVVAGAIEELGSAGRLVVVVTHVRELADRLPVRMEVVKTAVTATVERVDA